MKYKNKFCRMFVFAYLGAILSALFLFAYMGVTQNNDVFQARQVQQYHTVQNVECYERKDSKAPAGVRKEYLLEVNDEGRETNYLAFYLVHHYAQVYVDDELIYSLMPQENRNITKTVGCNWVMIPLDWEDTGREIKVIVTPVYKSVANRTVEFLVGSKYSIFISRLQDDALDIALSIFAVIVGVVFISISVFSFIQKGSENSLFYLGVFSVCIGLWKISDIRSASLLFPGNSVLIHQVSLAALSLSVVSFAVFIREQFKRKRYRLLNSVCFLSVFTTLAQLFLQITGMVDLRESLWASHMMIILTAAAVIQVVIAEWRAEKTNKKAAITFVCFLLCAAGVLIDLVTFYVRGSSYEILNTLVVFLIYTVAMGVMSVMEMNERANIDFATGLFNRSRCREIIADEAVLKEPVCLLMFDLNELKKINDTFGHEAGDRLIYDFAGILKKELPSFAFLGRYGGDEFIAVIKQCNETMIQKILANLAKVVKKYNDSDNEVKLSYSAGYALSTDYLNCTMAFLMEKADLHMYENKKNYYENLSRGKAMR